jgi:tRNA threonylcarbamoyladenosine biosynthesis protein TsaB
MSPDSPLVLAFDTSSQVTSVAVCRGEEVLAADDVQTEERHAEVLLPKAQRCLAAAGQRLEQVDLIGVGVGPGSFTGLRVGVATAKGLGLALRKPVIPIVSLEALAHPAPAGLVAACLDAYKGELFAAVYRRTAAGLEPVVEPFHALPALVAERLAAVSGNEPLRLLGSGIARYPELLAALPGSVVVTEDAVRTPSARVIGVLAGAAFARGEVPELASVLPVYLRGTDAQLPRVPLRL